MEVISLYEMEISPIKILSLMKNNIYNHFELESINNIDKTYTLQRKSLISLIHKISNQMGFKSQTFFMAINYLDIIFSKQNNHSYNYGHLAVACLIIAFKYCENVPLRPIFKYFVNFYNNEIPDNQKATKEDLFNYEVIICKLLDYKLNYFTIYDFNFFFFGNGVIKIEQLKQINSNLSTIYNDNNISTNINNSSQIKKILINIYERSRHYLDVIIENLICLKYNSLLISICIMERSIDYALLNDLNLTNLDDSVNIEEIKFNNRKYFKQIMNDFYKIDYESLPEYEYLKIDCENYKLFDDIYDKENIKLNKSNNMHLNQVNNIKGNNSSPKNMSNKETISINSPNISKNNETKDKISYLYKKVNVPSISQNNNYGKYNINQIRKKQSPKNRINNSRQNNFLNENFNIKENNSILNTFDNLCNKNQNNLKNSFSNKKNGNNMIKCNTSNSPLQNSLKKNKQSLNKKSIIFEKMKNQKKFNDLEEKRRTNSKSIDLKNNLIKVNHHYNDDNKLRNKRINVNLQKPYIKKVIQNYDITQEDFSNCKDNKNISININSNNKILSDEKNENKDRDRNKSTKKIIISKYLNKSMVRKKSIAQKSKNKNQRNNFESSPIFKRDSSNYKYNYNCVPFKFNKKNCPINTKSINQNISNSNYFQEYENVNSSYINKSPYQKDIILKAKTNFNIYNSNNMTSRNSLKYNNYNSKLTDSLINIKTNKLNSDLSNNNEKNISIIDYNHIDNTKKYEQNKTLKNKNQKSYFIGIKSESLNKTSNMMNESNYLESHKNKTSKINHYENNINNNISIKEFNEKDNYDENKEDNNDGKQKTFSNKNLLDYSTGAS